MAKKTNANEIMESIAPETVHLTIEMPRVMEVALHKETGIVVKRDLSELVENPKALQRLLTYGIGRFNRDGAVASDEVKEGEVTRKRTPEEFKDETLKLSNDKWAALLEGRLRTRIGGTSDPLIQECRILTVKALVKRGVQHKAIPKLNDLAAMEKAVAAYEDLWTKIRSAAEKVVALRATEDL